VAGALYCERLLEWLSLQPAGGCWSTRLYNGLHALIADVASREWKNTLLWEHDAPNMLVLFKNFSCDFSKVWVPNKRFMVSNISIFSLPRSSVADCNMCMS
jgi:hypothetical protein